MKKRLVSAIIVVSLVVVGAGRVAAVQREGHGALAEQLAVPASSLFALPDQVDDVLGALVEPGGNALRAADAAALDPGGRVLVLGPGTIGLLAAMFARAAGAEVHLLGLPGASLDFAAGLGFDGTWTEASLPHLDRKSTRLNSSHQI